jgi:hypothetical protein
MKKGKAVLGLNRLNPIQKAIRAQSILDAMQGSGHFPAAQVPLSYSALQLIIDNLKTSIQRAAIGPPAATSYMHDQERLLVNAFNLLKTYVEFVANSQADTISIITSAHMQVAGSGGYTKVSSLTVNALGGGVLEIRMPKENDERIYILEYSNDGETFSKIKSSAYNRILIRGLVYGTTVYFRYYAIYKDGEGPVSEVRSVIVL